MVVAEHGPTCRLIAKKSLSFVCKGIKWAVKNNNNTNNNITLHAPLLYCHFCCFDKTIE